MNNKYNKYNKFNKFNNYIKSKIPTDINNLRVTVKCWGKNMSRFVIFVIFNTMRTCFKVKPIARREV